MPYPPPKIHEQSFEGGVNTDLADELMAHNMMRYCFCCRVVSSAGGSLGIVQNLLGNTMITTPLAEGENITIGSAADERNGLFYFAVWNPAGYHKWFMYNEVLNNVTPFINNLTDTDGIDILKFNKNFPIFHIDLDIGSVNNKQYTRISWCDALNKGRKTNIQRCLDKSLSGYGYTINEDFITLYKKAPVYAPTPVYFTQQLNTDGSPRNNNYLYQQLFKFCYRYIYFDGEQSNYSDWSIVALPPNQSYQGQSAITLENNGIYVGINTGGLDVVKIEIAMQTTGPVTTNGNTVQGAFLNWQTIAILNKPEQLLADDTVYQYQFYNDGSYVAADQSKINRPYSFMFRVPTCQAIAGPAFTQTGGDEGFPFVAVNLAIAMQYQSLFLPPDTVNQLNSPSLTIAQTSYATERQLGIGRIDRYNPTILFTVGADVKKGNVFTINGQNGGSDNYTFSYIATAADTAISVANQIKAFLRGIGRGIPDAHNGISGEGLSSGNSFFSYSYLGRWHESITTFTGYVNPVYYETLKDNGLSIQVIKSGSIRQYAIGYEDDDGRKTNAYTNDACIIRTPFLTEAPGGVLQQPVHEISIFHQPPVWARRWILYRTPDESQYIQLLIQQVIDVTVISAANPGEYLDLVVGSLNTYNLIHPDSILSYQFTRGDRLRLIRNENTGDLYTPFYETEVLSYNEVTTELRNAQIATHGTDLVEPSDGVIADYLGKNIQIAGIERTIINVSGGSYVLDQTINIGGTIANVLEPNYTFIDRRGIIRIYKPQGYVVASLSTVEVFTPQKTTNNLDFNLFNDTAQKFEVLNFGTDTRSHAGSHQNQDGTDATTLISTPAIVLSIEGDAYIRYRELPTNNATIDTEIIVDSIEDPNLSDFYPSALNNLGRVYPKDDGTGQKHFGSRTRFSNNHITDTAINGYNDFDDLDRVDNDDSFGDVSLTKTRESRLYLFKKLRDAWLPIQRSIISTTTGQEIIGLSDKLLGPIQYLAFDGGIGDNPESWFANDNYMYHAMASRGVFVRIAGDGIDPISKLYGFDYGARQILASVKKYRLRIPGAFDSKNDDAFWSAPEFIPPLFNGPINQSDWDTTENGIPDGSTVVIDAQPANGVVTYNSGTDNFDIVMTTGFVGTDTFRYHFILPDTTTTESKNGCITVVARLNNTVGYRGRASTNYCTQILASGAYVNDGNETPSVLEGYYVEDGSLSGFIMPNIRFVSPQAIVPDGTSITYHETTSPAPSGGANGDIWYNEPVDDLYKKISGTWVILTDRVLNSYFATPTQNLTDCPLPPPPAGHFTASAQYGVGIVSIVDGTSTGTPAAFATANLLPSQSLTEGYTTMTAGTIIVTTSGTPSVPGHIKLVLQVAGVQVGAAQTITGSTTYTLTFISPETSPTDIVVAIVYQ